VRGCRADRRRNIRSGLCVAFYPPCPLAEELDPGRYVAFLADNEAVHYIWNLIICVLNGVVLLVLARSQMYGRDSKGPTGLDRNQEQ
jgi:hypothetical protein